MKTVWILADDRAGNVNQLLGIAEALGLPFERKDIRYDKWIKLPNFLRGASLLGLDKRASSPLSAPYPDLVLSAGRRSFPIARFIQRASGNHTQIVQLMNPGLAGFSTASLVILPAHDQYRGHRPNVQVVVGSPHRITPERLSAERKKWDPLFTAYPHKRISLIVGGATKDHPFTPEMANELVQGVKSLAPASLLVTTSRRTPLEVIDVLTQTLPKPFFLYRFGDKAENPYFGLLSCADEIVVTGDSMSMCSECCATGVPVYIFAPDRMMSAKHKRFHRSLYQGGYASPLGQYHVSTGARLNPTGEIVNRIRELLK